MTRVRLGGINVDGRGASWWIFAEQAKADTSRLAYELIYVHPKRIQREHVWIKLLGVL